VLIEPAALVPLTAMHRTHGNGEAVDERVDFFFTCTVWSGVPQVLEPKKSVGLRWFALDALPDPVVPHEQWVLEHLKDGGLESVLLYVDEPEEAERVGRCERVGGGERRRLGFLALLVILAGNAVAMIARRHDRPLGSVPFATARFPVRPAASRTRTARSHARLPAFGSTASTRPAGLSGS